MARRRRIEQATGGIKHKPDWPCAARPGRGSRFHTCWPAEPLEADPLVGLATGAPADAGFQ